MMLIKLLLAYNTLGCRRLLQLTAVSCVVLLVVQLQITHYYNSESRVLSAEHSRPERESNITMLYHYNAVLWPHNDSERIMSQIDFIKVYARQKRNRTLKIILRVGNFNLNYHWMAGQKKFIALKCPIVDCWMTKNRSYAHHADVLLISEINKRTIHRYLPKPRGQIWIAQHWESPLHNRIDPYSVRGLINWTASYRHDSTVPFRYEMMVPMVKVQDSVVAKFGERGVNYAAGKTKFVAWFVSNCVATNHRLRYARQLRRYIQV